MTIEKNFKKKLRSSNLETYKAEIRDLQSII